MMNWSFAQGRFDPPVWFWRKDESNVLTNKTSTFVNSPPHIQVEHFGCKSCIRLKAKAVASKRRSTRRFTDLLDASGGFHPFNKTQQNLCMALMTSVIMKSCAIPAGQPQPLHLLRLSKLPFHSRHSEVMTMPFSACIRRHICRVRPLMRTVIGLPSLRFTPQLP